MKQKDGSRNFEPKWLQRMRYGSADNTLRRKSSTSNRGSDDKPSFLFGSRNNSSASFNTGLNTSTSTGPYTSSSHLVTLGPHKTPEHVGHMHPIGPFSGEPLLNVPTSSAPTSLNAPQPSISRTPSPISRSARGYDTLRAAGSDDVQQLDLLFPPVDNRSRASSHGSSTSSQRTASSDELVRRKLGKLFFWEKSDKEKSDKKISQQQIVPAHRFPDFSDPPNFPTTTVTPAQMLHPSPSRTTHSGSGDTTTVPGTAIQVTEITDGSASSDSVDEEGTVPFPKKQSPFNSSFTDISRVFFEPDLRLRRRKTEEGINSRSRSSSLGFGYHSHTHYQRTTIPMNRTPSSDDIRHRRQLPLPPPPTIGVAKVADDPVVVALNLDPMAVQYADHMHMLGYTRNRHICALLAREGSKEGIRYNSMVMQAFVMRMLRFHGEPLDMSLRKYLFRMALAVESQQIERQLHSFSVLWHFQNPRLFADEEQVLSVVYSLVMLHTDTFNKNVKYKMSKTDYVRGAAIEGMAPEIFEYFYDNITATPFRADDEVPTTTAMPSVPALAGGSPTIGNTVTATPSPTTPNYLDMHPLTRANRSGSTSALGARSGSNSGSGEEDLLPTILSHMSMEGSSIPHPPSSAPSISEDSGSLNWRRSASFTWIRDQPPDPYPYLLENRLDALRPALGNSISPAAPLTFCGIESGAQLDEIREQLTEHSGLSLQLRSGRQRTDTSNDSHMTSKSGLVDISVVKHGVILRREYKRTLGVGGPKPVWREWGLVLTISRLYFFKNASWLRQLSMHDGTVPISFEVLQSAKAISTRDVAALVHDSDPPRNSQSSKSPEDEMKKDDETSGGGGARESSGASFVGTTLGSNSATSGSHRAGITHTSAGPDGRDVFDFVLVEGGRDSAQQCFAAKSAEDMASWVRSINTVAAQASLNVGLLPRHTSPAKQIAAAIDDVDEQISQTIVDIDGYQRTLEHFQVLAPLYQRTREKLVFTAGRYSSRCDDAQAELARLHAYRNILSYME